MTKLTLEFSGGLETLFGKQKKMEVDIPSDVDGNKVNMKTVIAWIKDNKLEERPELFVSQDTVRPGILVLINDTDWELVDQLKYDAEEDDNIMFISTLHGADLTNHSA